MGDQGNYAPVTLLDGVVRLSKLACGMEMATQESAIKAIPNP
jgi:hypothetical protein